MYGMIEMENPSAWAERTMQMVRDRDKVLEKRERDAESVNRALGEHRAAIARRMTVRRRIVVSALATAVVGSPLMILAARTWRPETLLALTPAGWAGVVLTSGLALIAVLMYDAAFGFLTVTSDSLRGNERAEKIAAGYLKRHGGVEVLPASIVHSQIPGISSQVMEHLKKEGLSETSLQTAMRLADERKIQTLAELIHATRIAER